MTNKWTLKWGITQGDLASRDNGIPENFDSRREAIDELATKRRIYQAIGYTIWYAYLFSPAGKKEEIKSESYELFYFPDGRRD